MEDGRGQRDLEKMRRRMKRRAAVSSSRPRLKDLHEWMGSKGVSGNINLAGN